ncbi:malonate decarboxylase holo-ACP synthase [Acinetobacter baylyi]|uniref:malonate decarboxylase holo-ACP synthase n=1 Tax=Acinetobacter baylyi TaxID=202950 RepID=UPI003969C4B7
MSTRFRPHDLLWGMTCEMLPEDAPHWVKDAVGDDRPVVVRRAKSDSGIVPVGIRGMQRNQRFATHMNDNVITKCVQPESLVHQDLRLYPHLEQRLNAVASVMNHQHFVWGYTGSVGFELATGLKTVTQSSDIDLLIRTEQPMSKLDAQDILKRLADLNLRIDIQLQTPNGGVALQEWASVTGKVLLKRNEGAFLVENPWR